MHGACRERIGEVLPDAACATLTVTARHRAVLGHSGAAQRDRGDGLQLLERESVHQVDDRGSAGTEVDQREVEWTRLTQPSPVSG